MARAGQRVQRLARAVLGGRLEKRVPDLPLPSLSHEQGLAQLCSVAQLPAATEAEARQGASLGNERQPSGGWAEGHQAREVHSADSSRSPTLLYSQPSTGLNSQPLALCGASHALLGLHTHLQDRQRPHGAFVYGLRELHPPSLILGSRDSSQRVVSGFGINEAAGMERAVSARRGGWLFQPARGLSAAKVSGSDVKVGNVIERKGKMLEVVKTQHTQQGRGGATIQVELRDVHSGLKSTEKLRTAEPIEVVFVDAKPFSFLYSEGDVVHLMEPETYDQLAIPQSMLGDVAKLLKEGMQVHVKYFNGEPLMASLPARVTVKVVEAEPHVKGNTATPSYKKVTVEGGLTVGVPPFVVEGDEIVVQTSDLTYVTRA